jgi:tripartite-type tricarboxylate transporter receptor subunit TctC
MVYQSVANGDVQWAFGTAGSSGPMYRAKKVKYLAIASPKRNGLFPDVPTVAEAGGSANFELGAWIGLAAPSSKKSAIEYSNGRFFASKILGSYRR